MGSKHQPKVEMMGWVLMIFIYFVCWEGGLKFNCSRGSPCFDPCCLWNWNWSGMRAYATKLLLLHQMSSSCTLLPAVASISSRSLMDLGDRSISTVGFLSRRSYDPPSWASHLNPIPSHSISLGHVLKLSLSLSKILFLFC